MALSLSNCPASYKIIVEFPSTISTLGITQNEFWFCSRLTKTLVYPIQLGAQDASTIGKPEDIAHVGEVISTLFKKK